MRFYRLEMRNAELKVSVKGTAVTLRFRFHFEQIEWDRALRRN